MRPFHFQKINVNLKIICITQQIKEQDKCPPNQTKEEEIGNLPDKVFCIMIVNLIQNLEI